MSAVVCRNLIVMDTVPDLGFSNGVWLGGGGGGCGAGRGSGGLAPGKIKKETINMLFQCHLHTQLYV